jgi:hypothetical protein
MRWCHTSCLSVRRPTPTTGAASPSCTSSSCAAPKTSIRCAPSDPSPRCLDRKPAPAPTPWANSRDARRYALSWPQKGINQRVKAAVEQERSAGAEWLVVVVVQSNPTPLAGGLLGLASPTKPAGKDSNTTLLPSPFAASGPNYVFDKVRGLTPPCPAPPAQRPAPAASPASMAQHCADALLSPGDAGLLTDLYTPSASRRARTTSASAAVCSTGARTRALPRWAHAVSGTSWRPEYTCFCAPPSRTGPSASRRSSLYARMISNPSLSPCPRRESEPSLDVAAVGGRRWTPARWGRPAWERRRTKVAYPRTGRSPRTWRPSTHTVYC